MCQNKLCVIYQYLLFNADRLKDKKKLSLERLKRSKDITLDDLIEIQSDVIRSDVFEQIAGDLFKLLNF